MIEFLQLTMFIKYYFHHFPNISFIRQRNHQFVKIMSQIFVELPHAYFSSLGAHFMTCAHNPVPIGYIQPVLFWFITNIWNCWFTSIVLTSTMSTAFNKTLQILLTRTLNHVPRLHISLACYKSVCIRLDPSGLA